MLVVWKLDILSRSLKDLLDRLKTLEVGPSRSAPTPPAQPGRCCCR
ncbi:hypothetical protein [Deinococcus detaillensis]